MIPICSIGTANEVAADGPEGEQGLGYIWDAAIRKHLGVRNYGFFMDLGRGFQIDVNITDPCSTTPPTQVAFPAHPSLISRTDFCFRGYDNSFPDFFRYKEWAREFGNRWLRTASRRCRWCASRTTTLAASVRRFME